MDSSQKPVPHVPSTDTEPHTVPPQSTGAGTVSRRDFLAATAATGIALGAGQSVSALAQDGAGPRPATAGAAQGAVSSALPNGESFEMYDGTAAGAVLAQLRAAGVRMIFHTNTSGFGPFWEAIDRAGDVQVINVTHEALARLATGIDRWIVGGLLVKGVQGTTELFGRGLRLAQTGNLQTYAFLFVVGLAVLLFFFFRP